MRSRPWRPCLILSLVFLPTSWACTSPKHHRADLVVYGGTAGGTIAAIAGANEGLNVILLDPGRHIGGMVTGGLGRTDHGQKEVVGGMSRAFFEHLGGHYGTDIEWYFEPHVAERVLNDWLAEAGVTVLLSHRLATVRKTGARIHAIVMENGRTFTAPIFMDASYEGDLMAWANVSYTIGREGRDRYGESLAGRREHSRHHQFPFKMSPHDDNGRLMSLVYDGDPTPPGDGDHKVQAYNFRLCLTKDKGNQVPFPKPTGYDPKRYDLLARYLQHTPDLKLSQILSILPVRGNKTDVNNNGPISTDHIGANWDYPDADYATRARIWRDHIEYTQGFFYFLAQDSSVPSALQAAMNEWGLAKDEFVDNDHWPHQLYIREARRMIGEYVMTQADLQTRRTKSDSIGMGSYNSDSHHVQRIPTSDGGVVNEGDMQVPVQPYEISYRALLPQRHECENLFVVACVSASHVAYSSIRMEPVYMIMGHSAGVAAAMAIQGRVAVHDVSIEALQNKLRAQGQVLSWTDPNVIEPSSLSGYVLDDQQGERQGSWPRSRSVRPYIADGYLHDNNESKGQKSVRFLPDLPEAGRYEIRLAYTPHANRATNAPVTIHHAEGTTIVQVNQRKVTRPRPCFVSLGTYRLDGTASNTVIIGNTDTDGFVVVDAVQWVRKP